MPLQLAKPRFDQDAFGYPFISIEIDGTQAAIPAEQKAFADGCLFLGSDFEDTLTLSLPADPDNGRPQAQILHGYSDDPRLLILFEQFLAEINAEDFAPRDVTLPELGS